MEGMNFGTDVDAFDNAAKHILEDDHSKACLATMGLVWTEEGEEKGNLNEIFDSLTKKNLAEVFANDELKKDLYTLFGTADACIASNEDCKI